LPPGNAFFGRKLAAEAAFSLFSDRLTRLCGIKPKGVGRFQNIPGADGMKRRFFRRTFAFLFSENGKNMEMRLVKPGETWYI